MKRTVSAHVLYSFELVLVYRLPRLHRAMKKSLQPPGINYRHMYSFELLLVYRLPRLHSAMNKSLQPPVFTHRHMYSCSIMFCLMCFYPSIK